MTLVELLSRPEAIAAARAEFAERTEGARFVAPLLPRDFTPPLDYRWPEYVTTARGSDWWIPAAAELEAAGAS
jgi:aminobenzoyl-glutamate utilization protein B